MEMQTSYCNMFSVNFIPPNVHHFQQFKYMKLIMQRPDFQFREFIGLIYCKAGLLNSMRGCFCCI